MKILLHLLFGFIVLGCMSSMPSAIELKPADAQKSPARTTWQYDGMEISLYGPDQPETPIVWEGPLELKSTAGTKQYELNLISNLYAMGQSLFALSYSGNLYYLDMFNLSNQVHLVKAEKISSARIEIEKQLITVMSACECVENDICHCNAGQVFTWDARGIKYNKKKSLSLTKKQLGTEFEGTKKIRRSSIKNGM